MTTQTETTWRKVKLGEIANIAYGKDLPTSYLRNSGYPVYGGNGIIGYSEKYLFEEPKVIIGCRGANSGNVFLTKPKSFITHNSLILDIGQEFDPKFLFYKLFSSHIKQQVVTGSAQPQITINELEQLELEIPELTDQKRIAQILSAFDDKIELNNKISAVLEQMAQTIFKEWFVNFHFPGHEKIKMVDSELCKIPEGWEVKSWGNLEGVSLAGDWGEDNASTGYSQKVYILRGTDIPSLQAGNKGDCPIRYISDESFERRKLQPGDIVIEISGGSKGQPTGRSIFITKEILERFELPLVCTSFCRLVRGNGILAPILMYLHINRLYKTKKIWNYQLQSTGISNFQYGQFKEYEQLVVPPKAIQEKIVDNLYSYIEYGHRNENQKLAALRDLLLPKLMSGEIRV